MADVGLVRCKTPLLVTWIVLQVAARECYLFAILVYSKCFWQLVARYTVYCAGLGFDAEPEGEAGDVFAVFYGKDYVELFAFT